MHPDNFQNFDGTVRTSILRGYPRPITVPVAPLVRLLAEEIERVHAFAARHRLGERDAVVLFECSSSSGQSFIDAPFAEEVCRLVLEAAPGAAIVLSAARGAAGAARDPRILDGSELSYRETAGLTRFSTLLVGGSSGITWLATAEGCKRLPMIQLLRRRSGVYASMVHDRRHFGLPADDVIEMTDCSPAHAARCITTVLERGVPFARARFHEELELRFDHYFDVMLHVAGQREFGKVATSLGHTIRRYGFPPPIGHGSGESRKPICPGGNAPSLAKIDVTARRSQINHGRRARI